MNDLTLFDSIFGGGLDHLFDTSSYHKAMYMPRVDIKEKKDAYVLHMDLPGRKDKDVDIELDKNVLTISSKTNSKEEKEEKGADGEKYLVKERRMSSFSRSFTLPEDVAQEGVKASFKDGTLEVTMPRKALAAPKKIAIGCE